MPTLVLLRHGESVWNRDDLFTGWTDVELTGTGRQEALLGGDLLRDAGLLPDVVHTSLLKRAIHTAQLALERLDRDWVPVRRSWRLNERHYGDLQGKNKAQTLETYGAEQFQRWRRSYAVPPPPLDRDDRRHARFDVRYARLPSDVLPAAECLADVVARTLPYWYDAIVPDLAAGHVVLVAAHGNSLRALVKHLDGIGDDEIVGLNIPTGVPLVYVLDDDMQPSGKPVEWAGGVHGSYLGDEETVRAKISRVATQGTKRS